MAQHPSVAAFRFKRAKNDGKVLILNEHSYLMGSYNQRNGTTLWERVVPATQKSNIEAYLLESFPVSVPA